MGTITLEQALAGQQQMAHKPQGRTISLEDALRGQDMERVASTINLNDRWGTLQVLRSVPNEHLQDLVAAAQRVAAKAPPAGYVKRLGKGLATGAAGFAQGIAELAGLGGTEDEIAVIQQLEAASRQELYPKGASTLANIPVQATEMAFPAVAMAGGGALAGGAARAALGAGALGSGAAGAAATGMGAGAIETAATIGGVTAATFPGAYRQSKAEMRDAGVDSWIAKPVAAGTSLIVGALEGIVPNPFKSNPVFGQGVRKAVSSYLASVLRQYPGELSEEFLQSVVSGAGETAATYMDTNAPDVPFDGKAFKKALSETVQLAGPLALVMGVPAAAQLPGVVANEMQQQAPAPVVAPPAEQAPPPVQAPPVAPEPTPPAPVVRDESVSPDVMGPPEAPPSRAMQVAQELERMPADALGTQFFAAQGAPIAARPVWYEDVKRLREADPQRSWRDIRRELVTGGRFADAEPDRVAEETAKQQEVGEAFAARRFENAEAEAEQLASEKWLPVDPESPPPAEYVEIRPGQFGRDYYRFLTKRGGKKDAGRQRVPDERKPSPTRYVEGVPGPEAEAGADRPGQVGPTADDVRGVPDGGQTSGGLAEGVEPTDIMSVNPPEQVESSQEPIISERTKRMIALAEQKAASGFYSTKTRATWAKLASVAGGGDPEALAQLEKKVGKEADKLIQAEQEQVAAEGRKKEVASLPEWIQALSDPDALATYKSLASVDAASADEARILVGRLFGNTPPPRPKADTKRTPPVPEAAPQVAPEPDSGQKADIPTTAEEAAEAWAAKERVGVDAGFDLNAIDNQKQRILQVAKGITDEWKSLDEVTPKKIGRQAELRANVPKHLKDLRELGYAQMAWDRQGNTYHAKAGVPLPAWLTQSENDADLESLPDRKSVVEAAPIVSDGEVADTAAVPSGKTAPPANSAQAPEASPESAVLPTGNMTRESLESMEPGEVERIWRERTPGAPKFTQKNKSELIEEILGEEPPAPAPKKLGLRPFGAESTPPDRMVKRIGKSAEPEPVVETPSRRLGEQDDSFRSRMREFYLNEIDAWRSGKKGTAGLPAAGERYPVEMRAEIQRLEKELAKYESPVEKPVASLQSEVDARKLVATEPVEPKKLGKKAESSEAKQPWEVTRAEYDKPWLKPSHPELMPLLTRANDAIEANRKKKPKPEFLSKPPQIGLTQKEWRSLVKAELAESKFGLSISISGMIELDKARGVNPWAGGPLKHHKTVVEEALAAGKPVPDAVLADYPDLKPVAKTASTSPEVPTEVAKTEEAAKEPWQMTAQEAVEAGVSYSEWDAAVTDAYRNERIGDDHPAWKSMNEQVPGGLWKQFEGQKLIGQKVTVAVGGRGSRLFGEVVSATTKDGLAFVKMRDTTGRESIQYADNVDHLESWIADRDKKGHSVPDEARKLVATEPVEPKKIGKKAEPSEMMRQWDALKKASPDSILLLRVGDFYEAMGDDADVVASALGLTATMRGDTKMVGFPQQYLDANLAKLVKAGSRVSVADMVKPGEKPGKASVQRVVDEGNLVSEKPPTDMMSVTPSEQVASDLLGKLRFKQRSTPAIGSPERTALDAELADAEKAQEASSAKMAKLQADYDRTKPYSKKRETLKKQIDKSRSADGDVWKRWVEAKDKHRLAVMEDRAASDEPLVAIPSAYQVGMSRIRDAGPKADIAQKFLEPVQQAVDAELRKHVAKAAFLADGADKLPAEAEARRVEQAVRELAGEIVNNPLLVDSVDGAIKRLRGRIRGARIEEYRRITQDEIDKAVPPGSENRGALKPTRDMYEFGQMDKEVEKAKGIAKSERQAEKMLKEAKKGEAVANAKSLKPLVTKGSSVDQGWAGDVSAEQSRLMSDGRVIIDTEAGAIAKNDIATMRRNEQPRKSRVALFSQVWDSLSDKGDLDLLGVLERGEFDVAVFADKFDDPHFFSKDIVAYLSRVGKADSYSLMSGSGMDLLGFKRDGKLYAVAMGVAPKKGKIPMDVKAARGADPMRAAGSYSLGDLDDASPELLKLKQQPTRKGLRKGLSKEAIADLTHGRITPDTVSGMRGWHVEVGDTYFTALNAAPEVMREVIEKDIKRKMTDEEWATMNVAGAFLMELPDGTRHSGLGFILLSESAMEGTLAHELLHLGKAAGLIGKQEWQSMAAKYAPDEQDSLKQEEMIAAAVDMTHERDPQLYGILERVRAWVRRWLAKLGVGPMQANDVFMMLRSAGYWAKAKTPTDIMSVKYSRRGEGKKKLFGRPDLSNIGDTEAARNFVDQVDEKRNQEGRPEVMHDEDVYDAAMKMLREDFEGTKQRIIKTVRSGKPLNEEETVAGREIYQQSYRAVLRAANPAEVADLQAFVEVWRDSGAIWGRAGRLRRDEQMSPAERMARAIGVAALEPPYRDQVKRDAARQRGRAAEKAGDAEGARKAYAEADAINAAWAKRFAELKAKLRILGVDLDNLNEFGYSKQRAGELLGHIHHIKATPADKLYEYWRNAILSAPTTQMANALGNTLHSVWSLTAERAVEVLVNTVVRDPMGAQVGEYKYLLNGVLPGVARGARNFMATWRSESPTLEYEIGQVGQWRIEDPNTAIGDWSSDIPVLKQLAWMTSGKRIRWPQRLLGAVDDFAKSVFTEMEAGAQAYRIAKSEGKTGDALVRRTAELAADYQSQAWKIAYEASRELMFQQRGGKLVQAVTRQTLQARRDIMGLRYLLPFVTTPINIFATGVKKSPLGSIDIGKKMWENWQKGEPASKGLTPQMAQQVIAWAMVLALMDWTDPDDPKITGSAGELDPASREVGFRTRPPQSIKLGDQWYSYSRLEPFATALGLTIDWIEAFRSGDWDKMANTPLESIVGQAKNKTFLAGVADVLKALEADKPTDSAVQWVSNFATSWVPNVVRSASREAADTYPQRKVWGKGGEWWSRLGRRTLQKTEVSGLTEYPIYDVWGRPANRSESPVGSDWLYRIMVPMKTQEAEMFAADRLILNYNNANEEDATFPRIPQPYYRKDNETVYMTDGQFADFVRLSGEAAVAGLSGRAVTLDAANPTDAAVRWINEVTTEARGLVRERLIEQWAGEGGELSTTEIGQEAADAALGSLAWSVASSVAFDEDAADAADVLATLNPDRAETLLALRRKMAASGKKADAIRAWTRRLLMRWNNSQKNDMESEKS